MSATDNRVPVQRRADARENYGRVIDAAAHAFAERGASATLKEIAAAAGVGIGTLYRHFPDRRSLVDAVYRRETDQLCEAAPTLLANFGPVEALHLWTARFLDYMATREGMADALHMILTADEGLKLATRERMRDALALLIHAGVRSGELRDDLDVSDVLLALGSFALVVDYQHVPAETGLRLVDLLLSGLTSPLSSRLSPDEPCDGVGLDGHK